MTVPNLQPGSPADRVRGSQPHIRSTGLRQTAKNLGPQVTRTCFRPLRRPQQRRAKARGHEVVSGVREKNNMVPETQLQISWARFAGDKQGPSGKHACAHPGKSSFRTRRRPEMGNETGAIRGETALPLYPSKIGSLRPD